MKLHRPLAVIDLESTGLDPVESRILELGVVVLSPDGSVNSWAQRFNPECPIPSESSAIHGITDADVLDCPVFEVWAPRIWKAIQGKDIAGYNLWSLDLPLLDESLRRFGLKLNLDGVHIIDACGIFMNKEGRKLTDAVKKYCGRDHEDAHGAMADAAATLEVIHGQLQAYPDLGEMDLPTLAAFSRRNSEDGRQPVDLAGKLYRDADGDVRYAFGKARDQKVRENPGFGDWMLRQNNPGFPGSTVDALCVEFERLWPTDQGRL